MPSEEDVMTLLRRNLELAKENNRLLRKMRRAAAWGLLFQFLWIAIVIGIPIALYYYFLLPYFDNLSEGYQQFRAQWGPINIPGFGPLLDEWLGGSQTTPTP